MGILITGGAGYIGSHTIIELVKKNYQNIISIDNYSNSSKETYKRIYAAVGRKIEFVNIDLKDLKSLTDFFQENDIEGIIHFAALKSVPESVEKPLEYYDNNCNALINLLNCCKKFNINKFIFSSSCSVYGNPTDLPVTEGTPYGEAESPYAKTKQIGEYILSDFCKVNDSMKALSLRYFNPAGADESGKIGEIKTVRPNNLVPIISQQAIGQRKEFQIFGNDYNTRDGSCIRDYIHVSDISEAHVLAFEYLNQMTLNHDVFNLGSGTGNTTKEVVHAFERMNGIELNYSIVGRRKGDVEAIFANNSKAIDQLNWKPKRGLDEIVKSAWNWQQNANQ